MILTTVLLPMFLAVTGYLLLHKDEEKYYIYTMVSNVIVFVLTAVLLFMPASSASIEWVCDLGIHLEIDGFRKLYSLIISFMWMMTMLLSYDYFRHHHNLSRYYFFNLMTEGATLGVFMASDLYTALVFFEIMSFTSFPWVIQEETDGAIRAANTYLAVAVIGGLTALMGLFLISHELGTLTLSELYPLACASEHQGILFIASCCVLVGFGAKAGMFPLHIWLPKAHPVAPAPSSALLSGVLTKSGIWGILAITVNIFRYDVKWGTLILLLGTVTMFLGALLALFSIDLKRTLACSSMSQVGFILVAVGMMVLLKEENALAARGAILHMLNHSLFKLDLFMSAGVVYMNVHKLDLNEVKGFGRNKPFLMICFLLAAAGIAGIPSLNGYISKTLIHEAIVEGTGEYGYLKIIEWIFLISGGLTLAYMTKLFVCLFLTDNPKFAEKKKYMSISSYIALGSSAVILPVLGLTASSSMMAIAEKAMPFFAGAELEHHIEFYSLENLKGGIISIAIGVLIYFLIVRKFMIKDGVYVDLWPKKLDLEDLIYRPVLLKVLPDFFGGICSLFAENKISGLMFKAALEGTGRISELFAENKITAFLYNFSVRFTGILSRVVDDSVDFAVLVFRKTIFRPNRIPAQDDEENSLSYHTGSVLDALFPSSKGKHYRARTAYNFASTLTDETHQMTDSLSFALMTMALMIVLTFIYVLVLHVQ